MNIRSHGRSVTIYHVYPMVLAFTCMVLWYCGTTRCERVTQLLMVAEVKVALVIVQCDGAHCGPLAKKWC